MKRFTAYSLFVIIQTGMVWGQSSSLRYPGEFTDGADKFQFVRIKFESRNIPAFSIMNFFASGIQPWAHDYPDAEINMYEMLEENTPIRTTGEPLVLTFDDDAIFNYPVLYICEIGYWYLKEEQAVRLGEYIDRGGFIIVDDFRTRNEMFNFRQQMRKAIKGYTEKRLRPSDPIFNCYFEFTSLPVQSPYSRRFGRPEFWGWFDKNDRLALIVNYNNDIGDGWELEDQNTNRQLTSFKLGINYFIYSMTH